MLIDENKLSTSIGEKKILEIPMELISSTNINPRRGGLIMENVDSLAETNGEFPEIYLGLLNDELIIVDGYHRHAANCKNNIPTIKAFVVKFNTMEEIKKEAFISNINHGIKLSELDIALNIYDFYVEKRKYDPTVTLKSVILEYKVPERRGRALFYWAVINKEILNINNLTLANISFMEEYVKIISYKKQIIGQITEEFKQEFRIFYDKYNYLSKQELRLAIADYIEGKDYFDEKEKQEKIVEKMEKADLEKFHKSMEKIDSVDSVDRTGIASFNDPEITANDMVNAAIAKIKEEVEEKEKSETETASKEKVVKKQSISNHIKEVFGVLKIIRTLTLKGQAEITKEDYQNLNKLCDLISEMISDCDEVNNAV